MFSLRFLFLFKWHGTFCCWLCNRKNYRKGMKRYARKENHFIWGHSGLSKHVKNAQPIIGAKGTVLISISVYTYFQEVPNENTPAVPTNTPHIRPKIQGVSYGNGPTYHPGSKRNNSQERPRTPSGPRNNDGTPGQRMPQGQRSQLKGPKGLKDAGKNIL